MFYLIFTNFCPPFTNIYPTFTHYFAIFYNFLPRDSRNISRTSDFVWYMEGERNCSLDAPDQRVQHDLEQVIVTRTIPPWRFPTMDQCMLGISHLLCLRPEGSALPRAGPSSSPWWTWLPRIFIPWQVPTMDHGIMGISHLICPRPEGSVPFGVGPSSCHAKTRTFLDVDALRHVEIVPWVAFSCIVLLWVALSCIELPGRVKLRELSELLLVAVILKKKSWVAVVTLWCEKQTSSQASNLRQFATTTHWPSEWLYGV